MLKNGIDVEIREKRDTFLKNRGKKGKKRSGVCTLFSHIHGERIGASKLKSSLRVYSANQTHSIFSFAECISLFNDGKGKKGYNFLEKGTYRS